MIDFRLGEAIALLKKTAPFLLFRFLVYFGITLAYVLAVGLGAGIGAVIGMAAKEVAGWAFWGGFAGFGLVSGVLFLAREYLLYLVKAGHITVLVQAFDGKTLPEGEQQVRQAIAEVKGRFTQSSLLFGLDQLIKGVLKGIHGLLQGLARVLPIPGLEALANYLAKVIELSLTYVDEVILAWIIRTNAENPWAAARDALVLYAQNYGAMIRNAAFLALVVWGATFLIFLLALLPTVGLFMLFPGDMGLWALVISVVAALALKAALIEPLAMTATMQVFFKVIEGQEPNPEWVGKLEQANAQFRELGDKARAFVAPRPATESANPPPAT